MILKITYIIILIQVGILGCNSKTRSIETNYQEESKEKKRMQPNQQEMSTNFSTPETLVLQILPEIKMGKTTVHGKETYRTSAIVFIPNDSGGTISCPLNYFQESVSLPEKWILNDLGQKIEIINADKFKKVIVTIKIQGKELMIDLPVEYPKRIFDYFMLDIYHFENKYKGFDCYAFASSIVDVKYYPQSPDFNYKERPPSVGEIVVLANKNNLPDSIKHWAIYLGDNQYLSKFGRSGEGASSLITIMDLNGMKYLYESTLTYVATPKTKAKPWDGYKP